MNNSLKLLLIFVPLLENIEMYIIYNECLHLRKRPTYLVVLGTGAEPVPFTLSEFAALRAEKKPAPLLKY